MVEEKKPVVVQAVVSIAEPKIVAVPKPLKIKVMLADPSNYSKSERTPIMIALHATHGAEGPNKDFDEAFTISKPLPKGSRRSFGYVVDSDSVTRCVPDLLTAWHAGSTANKLAIGIEICGRADQTRAQWFDKVSHSTLCIAARLVADLCEEYHIPPVFLDVAALRQKNTKGITTHDCISKAWRESDHWDPGPNFPIVEFIAAVRAAIEGPVPA